jgi:hypothetical protein
MKTFGHTGLWRILDDPRSAIDNSAKADTDAILAEYVLEMTIFVHGEKDIAERCRTIEFEHGKLAAVSKRSDLAKSNSDLLLLIERAIALLDREIDIAKMELKHSGQQSALLDHTPAPVIHPSLHLIPKHRDLGVMGMAELLTALQLLGGIGSSTGKEPTTVALAGTFEQAFGFSYNDIYDRQGELFRRMPCNLTRTLDAMKTALTKEYRKRQTAKKAKDTGDKNDN